MMQLKTIILVLFSPIRGFTRALERPRSALAVAMIMACAISAHWSACSRLDMAAIKRLTYAQMTLEKPEKNLSLTEVAEKATRVLNTKRIMGYLIIVGAIFGVILASTVLCWVVFRTRVRHLAFVHAWSLCSHVLLPFALRQLLALPVIFSYPSIDPTKMHTLFRTDLNSLIFPTSNIPGLWIVDPFCVWMGVLGSLAGRAAGYSKSRSTIVGILLWLLYATLSFFLL